MSIMRKIILGYIVLVFIPVIIFGYHYYTQIYDNLTKQFAESRQKVLEQAYANLETDFARIQAVYRMIQYNPYITDYLDGIYSTEGESVYAFIRYIQPLFAQAYYAHPEIESIVIYRMKEQAYSIRDYMLDSSELDPLMENRVRHLKPGSGKWVSEAFEVRNPELIYYQYIYNPQYTEQIGLLEMRISSGLFKRFYEAAGIEGKWRATLMTKEGTPLGGGAYGEPALDEKLIQRLRSEENTFLINRKVIVNQIVLTEPGVRLIVTGQVSDVFHSIKQREIVMVTVIVLLLITVSIAYYMLASTITKRIFRLARHMRTLDEKNLKQHVIKTDGYRSKDEIGFLTETYNTMIERMDELINNAHRAEMRNKEAAYKVLQAQIKPHFLYNTLETIRMLAESNNDKEVADISYWFGKLMRYSLSATDDRTVLAKEIETVVFYLKIHKKRLPSRLSYEIRVEVDSGSIACPRFLLQPLVENCIVHGVSATLRPVHIVLHAFETEKEIVIVISDSGTGIAGDKLLELRHRLDNGGGTSPPEGGQGGVGLVNVGERVRSFFGGSSRLLLESEPGSGTSVTMIITKGRNGDENLDSG